MYKDFSDASKNRIIEYIYQVENDSSVCFTDWGRDRWCDYAGWISKLNIGRCLDNVNNYHRKVVEKNRDAINSIESVFQKERSIDAAYATIFINRQFQLVQWKNYIEELRNIMNPTKGMFSPREILNNNFSGIDLPQIREIEKADIYISSLLEKYDGNLEIIYQNIVGKYGNNINSNIYISDTLKLSYENISQEESNIDLVKKGLKYSADIAKIIDKLPGGNGKAKITSSILGYLNNVCGIHGDKDKSPLNITSNTLTLIKSSCSVETGLYKYLEKNISPYDAQKLDIKHGKMIRGLSILGDISNTVNDGIDAYKVFIDPNRNNYDKTAEGIELLNSTFDLGTNVYITAESGSKTLQFVSKVEGTKKATNQILASSTELQYTTSVAVKENISKIGTVVAIADVACSSVSGFVKQYGEIKERKGSVGIGDIAGEATVYGSLSGLNAVTSGLTLGIIHFDSKEVGDAIWKETNEIAQGDSWAAKYVQDSVDKGLGRKITGTIVASGIGGYVVGKTAVNGVKTRVESVCSWISVGYNTVTKYINNIQY